MGAERVVTNPNIISETQAKQPVKEYTEFIEQPKVQGQTEYRKETILREQQEAPIKLVEQPIKQVEQKTVIQQQPVPVQKQEDQVEKAKPIEVVKHVTETQTLPGMEKKEVIVQPVRSAERGSETVSKTMTEAGRPVDYKVTASPSDAERIAKEESHAHGVVGHIKETVGGVKTAAQGVLETAREKAREVFHHGPTSTTTTNKDIQTETSTQSSTTRQTGNVQ